MSSFDALLAEATTVFNAGIATLQSEKGTFTETHIDKMIGEAADSLVPAHTADLMQLFVDDITLALTDLEDNSASTIQGLCRQLVWEQLEQHMCGLKEDLLGGDTRTCPYCGWEVDPITALQRPVINDNKAWSHLSLQHHDHCPLIVTRGTMIHNYAVEAVIPLTVIAEFATANNLVERDPAGIYDLEYGLAGNPEWLMLAFNQADAIADLDTPDLYGRTWIDASLDTAWLEFLKIPRPH